NTNGVPMIASAQSEAPGDAAAGSAASGAAWGGTGPAWGAGSGALAHPASRATIGRAARVLMFVFWRWRRRWQAAPCVRELDGTRGPGRGGASRSGAHLVDLDDVAFRVVEEDLLPAAH